MSINAVLWASKLKIKPNDKLVMWALSDHYNDKSKLCYPSTKRIADFTGLSVRSVIRSIKSLEDQELIIPSRRHGTSNSYTLNIDQDTVKPVTESHQCQSVSSDTQSLGSDRESQGVVTESHLGSDRESLKPVINQEVKPVIEPEAKPKKATVHKIPTLEQVKRYAEEKGYDWDYEKFFYYWDSIDWKRKTGQKIKNWKSAMAQWDKNQVRFTDKPKRRKMATEGL